jgi:hypothetical protein
MDDGPKLGSHVASALPPNNRREVLVIGRDAPVRVGATRMAHVGRLITLRRYAWSTVLVGAALFLAGSTTGDLLWAIVPLLLVLVVQGLRVWREAGRCAERDFFAGYATAHRFNYSERMMLVGATPLLAAGERRRCTHYIEGPLPEVDGTSVALAHFVVETQVNKYDRRKRPIPVLTPHSFTVAIVDLQRPAKTFPGVYVERRRPIRMRTDWLDRRGLLPVMLSDNELASDCELLVRQGQDLDRLRLLVDRVLESWLVGSSLKPGFEYQDGTLLLYAAGRLRTSAELDELLSLTSRVAGQLLNAGEPLKAVEPSHSHAPPSGVAAFPAPPPATKPQVEPILRSVVSAIPEPEVAPAPIRRSVPPPGS